MWAHRVLHDAKPFKRTQTLALRKVENVGCVFSEREAKQAHTDPHPTKNRKNCSVFTGRQTDKLFKSQKFGGNCRFLRYKFKFIRAGGADAPPECPLYYA